MNQIMQIFILGLGILVTAMILNFLASFLGFATWYDFFINLEKQGVKETIKNIWGSLPFLILIYPFILGLVSYYLFKFLK